MEIIFDPISKPKRLKSAAEMEKLPETAKLVLEAGININKEQNEEEIGK